MVAVAQLVEPWIVIPVVVGSSPISHPIFPQPLMPDGIRVIVSLKYKKNINKEKEAIHGATPGIDDY